MLPLLEALIAAGALIGFLARVYTPVPSQLRGVLEALFAVRTLQRLLAGRIAAVLHELGGGEESAVTQRTLQRLLSTVRVLVALQRRRLFIALPTHVALVRLVGVGAGGRLAALVAEQLARLAEALAARGAFEEVVHAVDVLVVKEVGGLQESLVTEVAFERAVG